MQSMILLGGKKKCIIGLVSVVSHWRHLFPDTSLLQILFINLTVYTRCHECKDFIAIMRTIKYFHSPEIHLVQCF